MDLCALNGDFVPWPWSAQFYSQVVGQNWKIMDENGIEQSEVSLTLSETYLPWGNDRYTMIEQSLTNEEQVRTSVRKNW